MDEKMMKPYVGVLFITPSKQVVLQLRDKKPWIHDSGKISTFGGGVEAGEKLIETAIRETEEELSVRLLPEDFTYFHPLLLTREMHGKDQLCFFYTSRSLDLEKVRVNEGQGYVLVSRNDLDPRKNLAIYTWEILVRYFHG
jgi:8-oxo-dGTP pyrophosphatase MutT (NUDIX family)